MQVSNLTCHNFKGCHQLDVIKCTNVTCAGSHICNNSSFTDSNNIKCHSNNACGNSYYHNITEINCAGKNTCDSLTAKDVVRINCSTINGCEDLELINVNAIECNNINSCGHLSINDTNVSNVLCGGYNSCSNDLFLKSVTNIQCIGNLSCTNNVYMQNVSNIYCGSNATCQNTVIFDKVDNLICDNYNGYDTQTCSNWVILMHVNNFVYQTNCDAKNNCIYYGSSESKYVRMCWFKHECSGMIVANSSDVYCMKSGSCNNTTISDADNLLCLKGNSCVQSNIKKVKNILCYHEKSCVSTRLTNIEYKGVTCMYKKSCQDITGDVKMCKNDPDATRVCGITETCGYAQPQNSWGWEDNGCVFCYGRCFVATKDARITGVPDDGSDFLYPLQNICVPYWVYLIFYLIPVVLVWSKFDYYYNVFLKTRLNTILLLINWDDSKDNYVTRYNKITKLQKLLYSSPTIDTLHVNISEITNKQRMISTKSRISFSKKQTYKYNKVPRCDRDMGNLNLMGRNQNTEQIVNDDKDLVSLITGTDNNNNNVSKQIFQFKFENQDITNAQNNWMKSVYTNIVECDDIINLPADIWDIIIKKYCCWNTTNIDDIDMDDKSVADFQLHYIKYIFLKPQYFDHYHKMYQFLQIYSAFKICQEVIQFIAVVICFFTDEKSVNMASGWQSYQQFIATFTNFCFMPIHPLAIFYLLYFAVYSSRDCCGDRRLELPYIENNHPRLKRFGSQIKMCSLHSPQYKKTAQEQYLYIMSNCPPTFKYLLQLYWMKTALFIVVFIPLVWFPMAIFSVALVCCIACTKRSTTLKQKVKISLYVAAFCIVMIGVYGLINVYHGHMVLASGIRSFLAIDQCPNGVTVNLFDNFIVSNHHHFHSGLEFVVWLHYWII